VEKVISGHSHKYSTSNSVLSSGSKNQKIYVLDTGTSLYTCGIWYLTHNKVLDIVWRQTVFFMVYMEDIHNPCQLACFERFRQPLQVLFVKRDNLMLSDSRYGQEIDDLISLIDVMLEDSL
jgi:hypothetical protein